MTKKSAPIKDFEKTLAKLENIVDELESPQTSLEHSLKLFEQGISLARDCEHQLKSTEHKVQILLTQKDGSLSEHDFINEE